MYRRGFSIVELAVVIVIIGVLLTLAAVSFRGYQANARDEMRKTRAENIARHLEDIYKTGSIDPVVEPGTYPQASDLANTCNAACDGPGGDQSLDAAKAEKLFSQNGFDIDNIKSVGKDSYGLVVAGSATVQQQTNPTLPSPSIDTYIYQPISLTPSGAQQRCNYPTDECRSFNIFYMTEVDNVVHTIESSH